MNGAGLLLALAATTGTMSLMLGGALMAQRVVRTRREAKARAAALAEQLQSAEVGLPSLLRGEQGEQNLFDGLLERLPVQSLELFVRQSGVNWTPGTVIAYTLLGVSAGLLVGLLLGFGRGVLVALVGGALPFVHLYRRRSARQTALEAQLPMAVDMLVNALRAGYALNAAMRFIGDELPAPLGPEFARYFDEQQLGMDQRQALLGLQERMGSLDARMLVLAILIQRETGGNLSEVLGNVARVVRFRIEFRQQLSVLTAEANLSSIILAGLPVLMFLLIQAVSPEYMDPLVKTPAGRALLGFALTSLTAGFLVLRRVARIDV